MTHVSGFGDEAARRQSTLDNPLSNLLHLFSLSTNSRREKSFNSYFTLVKIIVTGVIFGALSVSSLYYKVMYIYSGLSASVVLTDALQMIYDFCQYSVDLYFVYKYGRHVYQEYYKQYTTIDQIIGTGSCGAIRKKINKLVIFFSIIWFTSSALDFTAWVLNYGWVVPIMFSLAYIYLFFKILTNLDLTYQTMHIDVRLGVINNLLLNYYTRSETLSDGAESGDPVQNTNWFYLNISVPSKDGGSLKKYYTNKRHEVRWLSRCYLLLMEQSVFINQMFGVRILMNSLSLLIDMIRFANLAIRIVIGSPEEGKSEHERQYFAAVSTSFRLLTCFAILSNLVHHCELVYRQLEKIICISDHLLINKNPDPELREAVTELKALVQARPIKIHMANFLKVDYTMLMSTISVVVTYTIILLQSLN